MPSEQFQREVTVTSDAAETWTTVTDIDQLISWVPILSEVDEHDPLQRYSALLLDRVGPFSMRADLSIDVVDLRDGESITIRAEGHDRQVDSRILVEGTMKLATAPGGTSITVTGHYEVTGRVANFGGPMIRSKAQSVIDDFFTGLTGTLDSR